MPVSAGPQAFQGQFPTFMSVYGDSSSMDSRLASSDTTITPLIASADSTEASQDRSSLSSHVASLQHKHRDSTSTQASESTDSSPTTTISTADSSSLSDPSPSSSPESPVTLVPLSAFGSPTFTINSLDNLTMSDKILVDRPALSYERPMTSPSPRRARNAKGLALKLPSLGGTASPPSDTPLQSSAPASPSFVKPPTMKPRKKPSILSLQTSANPSGRMTLGSSTTDINPLMRLNLEPPPTPSLVRNPMLRHHQSVPQIFSPALGGPDGGMRFPPPLERSHLTGLSTTFRKPAALKESSSLVNGSTIHEEESPIRTQMATRSMADIRGDIFDAPPSQEDAKSPTYPDGPVMIYEPHVFLYLEPTAEEASRFDVIMNVASEVKNPFKAENAVERKPASGPKTSFGFDHMDLDRDILDEPSTASTFKTAFEWLPDTTQQTPTESSPTTPKPAAKQPEYIHIPWEHNTDISKELMGLCELIDNRTKEGKKVLVHCQQGASRSASLIIAYGLYTNPSLSVNDAYHAAQKKSKWISPNMKLMYALQDFKKEVDKKKGASLVTGFGAKRGTGRSPTKHRLTLSADSIDVTTREPLTAPLPADKDGNQRTPSPGTPSRPRGMSTPNFGDITPGPSSAPSSYAWNQPSGNGPNFGLWTMGSFPKDNEPRPMDPPSAFRSFDPPSSFTSMNSSFPTQPSTGFMARKTGSLRDDSSFAKRPSIHGVFSSENDTPSSPVGDSLSKLSGRGFGQSSFSRPPRPGMSNSRPSVISSFFTPKRPAPTLANIPAVKTQFASQFATRQAPAASDEPPTPSLWSPRILEFTNTAIHNGFPFSGEKMQPLGEISRNDDPPTPELMSPRVAEFVSPFHHQPRFSTAQEAASSFGFSTYVPEAPPVKEDPRSPAAKGEVPIIRSIDDVL